jgi:hypothetical protein
LLVGHLVTARPSDFAWDRIVSAFRPARTTVARTGTGSLGLVSAGVSAGCVCARHPHGDLLAWAGTASITAAYLCALLTVLPADEIQRWAQRQPAPRRVRDSSD